jgi:hypothetical protein
VVAMNGRDDDRPPDSPGGSPEAGTPLARGTPLPPLVADREPTGEFVCPGCGRPLAITLRSDMCFAEAQVYCADCERDYQQRRGRWAPDANG